MNDQKRFLLAVTLIMALLVMYSFFSPKKAPPQKTEENNIATAQNQQEADTSIKETQSGEIKQVNDELVEITTPMLRAELSTRDAGIKTLWVKTSHEVAFSEKPLLRASEKSLKSLEIRSSSPELKLSSQSLDVDGNKVVYKLEGKEGINLEKKLIFSNTNYTIEIQLKFINTEANDKVLSYEMAGSSGLQLSSVLDKRFLNAGSYNGSELTWVKPKEAIKLAKNGQSYNFAKNPEWAVFRNTHFSTIIKPYSETSYAFLDWSETEAEEGDAWTLGIKQDSFLLPAKGTVMHNYLLYVGPTSEEYLQELGLSEAVNFGKLNVICKAIIAVLNFFYGVTHNYGVSIILLVIVINVCTYPLTYKNVKSMRHMQSVQPLLAELKEKHKEDQQKLQAEMMKLYKENNVNPLGGCLPMFLQMPIFISLYLALARSPELKGSNFLWIKDLSLPDALFSFGRSLPILGDSFNLLPLLMMVAMVVQQKVSMSARSGGAQRTAQEEQQQKMMLMMPIVFGFIFYNLPSGLVLYWTTNTALLAFTHYLIQKQLAAKSIESTA
jgi:YidC/Oxa1 family membrane protein insertase